MTDDGRLRAAATGQHGVVTRAQANQAGLSDAMLRSRIQSGFLDRIGVRTFRSPLVPPNPRGDLLALVLDLGGAAVASGPTAAALHGFDGFRLRPPFHVTVPRGRHPRRPAHHIHSTSALERIDRTEVDGIPVLSPTRTLIDLAASCGPQQLVAALDGALRDGGTSEGFLHRRVVALRGSGRVGIGALVAALDGVTVGRGGHSWLEREFLRLAHQAGLPRPATQQTLSRRGDRLVRVDCWFEGTPVVVELLGYRWHRTRQQLQVDAERMNRLLLDGYLPLQLTYVDVVEHPARSIDLVRAALASVA